MNSTNTWELRKRIDCVLVSIEGTLDQLGSFIKHLKQFQQELKSIEEDQHGREKKT